MEDLLSYYKTLENFLLFQPILLLPSYLLIFILIKAFKLRDRFGKDSKNLIVAMLSLLVSSLLITLTTEFVTHRQMFRQIFILSATSSFTYKFLKPMGGVLRTILDKKIEERFGVEVDLAEDEDEDGK